MAARCLLSQTCSSLSGWKCQSEVTACQCVSVQKINFSEMDSVRLVCDSSDISFRCSISAVSESPCSSDRVRKCTREGGREREREKGRETITKEADVMKERSWHYLIFFMWLFAAAFTSCSLSEVLLSRCRTDIVSIWSSQEVQPVWQF